MHLGRPWPRGGRAQPKWTCVHLLHFIILNLKNLPRTPTLRVFLSAPGVCFWRATLLTLFEGETELFMEHRPGGGEVVASAAPYGADVSSAADLKWTFALAELFSARDRGEDVDATPPAAAPAAAETEAAAAPSAAAPPAAHAPSSVAEEVEGVFDEAGSTSEDLESDDPAPAAAAAAPPPPPLPPAKASDFRIVGDGAHAVTVAQKASFTIESVAPRPEGGAKFAVNLSGAGVARVKVFDGRDGTYTVEYRVPSSGKYRLSVMLGGHHVPGSPCTVSAKAGSGNLKDWKAGRTREAAEMRAQRKEHEGKRKAPLRNRSTSPRLPSPRTQLEKAYALALAMCHTKETTRQGSASGRAPAPVDVYM